MIFVEPSDPILPAAGGSRPPNSVSAQPVLRQPVLRQPVLRQPVLRQPLLRQPPLRQPVKPVLLIWGLLAVVLVTAGCFNVNKRKQKTSASAIWISNNSEEVTASTLARLKDAGVEEAYVTAAELDLDGPDLLRRFQVPDLESSLPMSLAIRGEWSGDSVDDPGALGVRFAEAAQQLRFDVESRGALVVGIHLDFTKVSSFQSYAAFLEGIQEELSDDLFLSVTVQRGWIGKEGLASVTDAVDFVVPFLYGQRVSEKDAGDAWDFIELERRLRLLEELEVPYQLGIITLGTASLISDGGGLRARTTRRSMLDLLRNPSLKLRPGFSFNGVNRRVYTMGAERKTKVDDWDVEQGETVRMVRIATSDLEELLRLVEVWGLPHHLGQLFYRLPSEQEGLSLHSESLLLAFDPQPAAPDIQFDVSVQRRTGRGWLVRFGLESRNREFTELALLDNNFLQIITESGEFNRNVKIGDFSRYDMLTLDEHGSFKPERRDPNVLRLFIPILEGFQIANTGNIEVLGRKEPVLVLEARFLLPDGRTLTVGPRRWSNNSFEDEAGEPAP